MQLLTLLLFWIFFGVLASHLAKRRGRSGSVWFFLGLFLGLLGVLLLFVLPRCSSKELPPAPPLPLARSESWLKLWYYLDTQKMQQGPFEFLEFIKLKKEEKLSSRSFVWCEGMKEWKALRELPDLLCEIENNLSRDSSIS